MRQYANNNFQDLKMKEAYHKTLKKKKAFTPKYTPPELKPVEEVQGLFRQYFKQHKTVGHIMTAQDVKKHVLKKLTAKEDAVFGDAIKALSKEGFIEVQEDGVSLLLTQKGVDSFK